MANNRRLEDVIRGRRSAKGSKHSSADQKPDTGALELQDEVDATSDENEGYPEEGVNFKDSESLVDLFLKGRI